jgi:hypothetical protein
MLQELRDYWLPLLLFAGTLLVAVVLLLLVALMPFVVENVPTVPVLPLFADDATVRRSSIAGAIGLIVTAFVFFRPNAAALGRKSAKKPPGDSMAGA